RCYNDVGQYTTVPHHGLIDISTGDFGIDAWVKRGTAPDGGAQMIVDKRVITTFGASAAEGGSGAVVPKAPINGTSIKGYSLFLLNGRLWCQLGDGPFDNYDSTMTVPADGEWHLVALGVQRNSAVGGRFWVDGASS